MEIFIVLVICVLFTLITLNNASNAIDQVQLSAHDQEQEKISFEKQIKSRGLDVVKSTQRYKVSNRKCSFSEIYGIYSKGKLLLEIEVPDAYNSVSKWCNFDYNAKDRGVPGKTCEFCYKDCSDDFTWICKGSVNLMQAFKFAMCKL